MERLPLLATVTEAAHRYREHFFPLLRVIALPALGESVLLYLWYQTEMKYLSVAGAFFLTVQGLLLTLAALSCHRVILLGPQSVPTLGTAGNTARDWRFIGTALALFLITNALLQVVNFLVFIPLGVLKPGFVQSFPEMVQAIGRFTALAPLYVACRYAVCFPATAIDHPLRPKQAWEFTRGHGVRLLLLIGVAPWLLHFVQRTLANALSANTDYIVVTNFLFWLFLPLEIALLSICYRRLSQTAA